VQWIARRRHYIVAAFALSKMWQTTVCALQRYAPAVGRMGPVCLTLKVPIMETKKCCRCCCQNTVNNGSKTTHADCILIGCAWLCKWHQDVLDEKLAAERAAVESLRSQAAAARSALEAEQALVSQLKEEASIAGAASQQLMALEQQVGPGCAAQQSAMAHLHLHALYGIHFSVHAYDGYSDSDSTY